VYILLPLLLSSYSDTQRFKRGIDPQRQTLGATQCLAANVGRVTLIVEEQGSAQA